MLLVYTFSVRNNGTPVTGLHPRFNLWVSLDSGAAIPAPLVTEVGCGIYRFSYDAEASGEAVGQVDATPFGASTLSDGDRYIDVSVTRESSVLLARDSWLVVM